VRGNPGHVLEPHGDRARLRDGHMVHGNRRSSVHGN
jgi:hypothetical protein